MEQQASSHQAQAVATGSTWGLQMPGFHRASARGGSPRLEHVSSTLVLHSTTTVNLQVTRAPLTHPNLPDPVCLAETREKEEMYAH